MKRKLSIIAIESLAVGFAVFFLVSHAYAQVAITASGGNPAATQVGASNSCYPTFASGGVSNPAPVSIWPDSTDHAITGSYALDLPNCNSSQFTGNLYAACLSLTQALSNASQIANGISGFPQMVNTGTLTNVIQLQFSGSSCTRSNVSGLSAGQSAGLCEGTQFFPSADGGSMVATIYVNPNSPELSAQLADFVLNPTYATCEMAHEMSHAFGVADTYNYSGSSLMGSQCQPNMSANGEETPGNPWDSNTAATIRALNTNSSISVDISSCSVSCSSGLFQRFHQNSSGYWVPFCSTSASPATDDYDCDCRGSDPTCTDLETGAIVSPPAARCQTPDPSALTCSCNSNDSGCVDENENENDIYSPPAGVCQASLVPAGEVCTCFNGEASCEDTDGNSVAVPSDFSCGSSSGSSNSTYTNPDCSSCISDCEDSSQTDCEDVCADSCG